MKPITQQIITDAPGGGQLRLTIGQMVMRDMARYNVLRREGWAWLEAQGIPAVPPADAPEGDENDDLRMLFVARAQMLAALKGCERRGDGDEWEPCELPAEWAGIDGFVAHVPASLANVWHRWALTLNPSAFLFTMGEAEKNGDAVIVV